MWVRVGLPDARFQATLDVFPVVERSWLAAAGSEDLAAPVRVAGEIRGRRRAGVARKGKRWRRDNDLLPQWQSPAMAGRDPGPELQGRPPRAADGYPPNAASGAKLQRIGLRRPEAVCAP